MKFKLLLISVFTSYISLGQVGIGTNNPDATAILDVVATNKGILVPRVRLLDVANTVSPINTPAVGLLVWNTNTGIIGGNGKGFYFFTGSVWQAINTSFSNNLDQAYDFGGPGNGRLIVADSNPVHIGGQDGLLITGNTGLGVNLDTALLDMYNSKMFFYPKKAAFRAGYDQPIEADPLVLNEGAFNEDSDIGLYSFAAGKYVKASGTASFAIGHDNLASGNYSSAVGNHNTATGESSFTTGYYSFANGINSFASGINSIANGNNSFVTGSNNITNAYAETVVGVFNKTDYNDLHIADPANFNAADRVFSVGIGTGIAARKNGFEVFKNGKVRINDKYNLPLTDGATNQIITTDGAGNLSWTTPHNNKNIVSNTLFGKETALNFTFGSLTDLTDVKTALFPGSIAPLDGKVQIKLYVLCSDATAPTAFELVANDGTSDTTLTLSTPTNTNVGGQNIYTTDWTNWNSDFTKYYKVRLKGQGTNVNIANVYVLMRTQ